MKLAVAGYVLVSQLVASHPLHALLSQYDREIAALQNTQRLTGLRDPAAAARHGAAAVQQDGEISAQQTQRIARRGASANLAREHWVIDAVTNSQEAAQSAAATYGRQLTAETDANLRAYGQASATSAQRAYDARGQQLHEKELTLAYDLARRDGEKRFLLRLKLNDLHLAPAARAKLRTQLAALDAGELRAAQAQRRTNSTELGAYRAELQRNAAAASDEMDAQLRAKAGANYAILQRVFNESSNSLGAFPLSSALAALRQSYARSNSAVQISDGMRAAGADLAKRFYRAGAVDARSQHGVVAQLRTLQSDRAALYHSILAQIQAETRAEAALRGVKTVRFVSRGGNGIDLTPAVRSRLARDW